MSFYLIFSTCVCVNFTRTQKGLKLFFKCTYMYIPEPEFVIVSGAQESIQRNQSSLCGLHGGPVCQIGLSYRPARLGIDSWAP